MVKVAAAGLCHSDLTMIGHADVIGITPPVTLGHESAGTVRAPAVHAQRLVKTDLPPLG